MISPLHEWANLLSLLVLIPSLGWVFFGSFINFFMKVKMSDGRTMRCLFACNAAFLLYLGTNRFIHLADYQTQNTPSLFPLVYLSIYVGLLAPLWISFWIRGNAPIDTWDVAILAGYLTVETLIFAFGAESESRGYLFAMPVALFCLFVFCLCYALYQRSKLPLR